MKATDKFVQAACYGRVTDLTRLWPTVDINAEDGDGKTALTAALELECFEAVRWLVYHGASVDAKAIYQLLVSECTSDRERIVRLLHKGRASIRSKYEPFRDPEVITQAIDHGDDEVLKLLISRGADASAMASEIKLPPLIQALRHRQERVVRLLLEAGLKSDTRVLFDGHHISKGQTALMFAASCRLRTSVRLLLERGASVEDVDPSKKTALMYAFERYDDDEDSTEDEFVPEREFNAEVVRLLLKAESPIDAQSSSGQTALMMAVQDRKYEEAVEILLTTGASVEIVDKNTWTALMYAVRSKYSIW